MEKISEKPKGPVVLAIFDGWGMAKSTKGNPVAMAKLPFINYLFKNYPNSQLIASGRKVGLPREQRGNSEAGHLNLGAGRIVEQDVVIISKAIQNGTFFKNPAFVSAIDHALKNKSQMHLIGLLSGSQSPHVEMSHLYALLRLLDQEGVEKVYLHLFTDGRDAPQHGAIKYLLQLKEKFVSQEKIASIVGRYYGMDRNKVWERTEAVYDLLTLGQGIKVESPEECISEAYNRGETDEFIQPTVLVDHGKPVATIQDNDSVIFFNLRSDRARQLAKPFVQAEFTQKNPGSFTRKRVLKNIRFVAMTDFGPDLDHILTAFPSKNITETLPMVLHDYRQMYIAESEKFAHITFFFNGGYDHAVAGEERIMVPSPKVKYFVETPAMSAYEKTKIIIDRIEKNADDFIAVNYCNPDMMGHTGNMQAAIKGMEVCDDILSKLAPAILKQNGVLLVTSDHGNVESMINPQTNEVDTEHSNTPVPFILVSDKYKKVKVKDGMLADVAPTVLEIMGVKKTKSMTGKSLLIE